MSQKPVCDTVTLQAFNSMFLGQQQIIALTGSSVQAASAFLATTTLVRLVADHACYIDISTSPSAATGTGKYLPANVVDYIGVKGGCKIAAIQAATGGGTLFITEGA